MAAYFIWEMSNFGVGGRLYYGLNSYWSVVYYSIVPARVELQQNTLNFPNSACALFTQLSIVRHCRYYLLPFLFPDSLFGYSSFNVSFPLVYQQLLVVIYCTYIIVSLPILPIKV